MAFRSSEGAAANDDLEFAIFFDSLFEGLLIYFDSGFQFFYSKIATAAMFEVFVLVVI